MVSIAYKAQTLTISFVKENFVYLSQPIYRRRYLQKKCQEQERELQPGNSSNNDTHQRHF
nr:PREDICTED: uncharacterized protein LOC109032344 isoform X6 [Bemisia tabaci]